MRTRGEIFKWLIKHKLYCTFIHNVLLDKNRSSKNRWKCLMFQYGLHLIEFSFFWCKSPQGIDFWKQINHEYVKWYKEGK